MHIWHNIFRFFLHTKRKKNPSKTCCFTTGFEHEKNEGKRGRGRPDKKNLVSPTFSKTTYLMKNSSWHNVRKMFEVYSKKFCCLKKIICTHSWTRLWHQGIIAISCRIWKQKFRFLEKKNVPDVLQSIFICKFAQKYLIVPPI